MPKLTNCEISYERSVKVADYENKKFAARFSVLIEDNDNEDEVTELYGRQIVRFVEEKLGIRSEISVPPRVNKAAPPAAVAAPKAESSPADAIPSSAGEAPAEPKKKGPGRPKAEKKAEDKPAETQAVAEDFPEEPKAAAGGPTITDAQLREAIQNHVAKYQQPAEVRKLVQTYFPKKEGKVWQSQEIPADKREDFLAKLAAMNPMNEI